ncbi:MAG: sigma-70 family RNA polymerase sigma factor [Calditrichaeota bacterium]|nr:sigma-70 family RNA polymerase sigma factor [Calditrichota bacterium]
MIKRAQSGDKRAFCELVEEYDRQVFSLISRFVSDRQLAKDVYQEVFMNVYKNIEYFSFKSDFYTWIYRITVNTALSFIRKEKRHMAEQINEETQKAKSIDTIQIDEILSEAKLLPEKQRLVFFMRFQNDLKISEIADALKLDIGTVKGYLSRSIKRIRQNLNYI